MDHWVLWGKTRQGQATGDETHALIHHMVDVGAVASVLWDRVVAEALREDLCQAAGLECQEMGRVLAWLASLHDLGKASPAFQSRYRAAIPALQAAGLRLEPQAQHVMHHSAIGHAVLAEELPALLGAPPPVTRGLAAVIGGHHGTWRSAAPDVPYWELGDEDWAPLRRELVEALTDLFRAPHPPRWPADQREVNALLAVLAGLITMADWVGSTDAFPCQRGPSDLAEYLAGALGRAREAAERLLPARLASGEAVPFEQMFPFPPNAVQEAAIELAAHLEGPALVIVEAPTGSGKSEAALYLAEQLQARLGGAGTYVAMPTVTTSNQMHERVTAALSAAHPQLPLHPLLVHGQALWQRPPPAVTAEEGGPAAAVDPMAWFLPRKRSLLAPYGVGTVDQALLSVLPTSHFYLRLCGLARKTVIFDEVHAYDTYMSALFERLLAWLHALGSSVIILSATLPASTRRRLLEAFGSSPGIVPAEPCACPAISWRSGQRAGVRPLRADDLRRQVYLRWVGRDCVLADLKAALAQGGCAAVICNTVARAQEAYLGLKEARLVPPEELYLFHARYPQAWRDGIEARVLERFGKTRRRRGDERAILVATQVVEQSLDLDFDYMATDLAPVDLLIQRAGRLHRHRRPASERPPALQKAQLTIVRPAEAGGVPEVADEPVYEPYLLLRTLLALEGREILRTPADTGDLVAAVYDEPEPDVNDRPGLHAALRAAEERMAAATRNALDEARSRLLQGPDSRYFVGGQPETLQEDDPSLHRSLQALTRLADPSVQVVCLHRRDDGLYTDPEGGAPVQYDRLDDETARRLAQSSVSVTHRGVVFGLLAEPPPAAWARHPFLRHCRLAIFVDGICPVPGGPYTLSLTRELGLQVIKEVR